MRNFLLMSGVSPLIFLTLFWLFPVWLYANPVATEYAEVELISEVSSIQPGKSFWVALRLEANEGWHTYWRNPGDTGLPTDIDWQLPEGFSASEIFWPRPERIEADTLMNYGHYDDVYLLTRIDSAEDSATTSPVTLQAHVSWLVCKEICIPEQADLTLSLPVTEAVPQPTQAQQAVFAKARQALPRPSPWPVSFISAPETLTLRVKSDTFAAEQVEDVWFIPFQEEIIDNTAPQTLTVYPRGFSLEVQRAEETDAAPEHLRGLLLLQTQGQASAPMRAFNVDAVAASDALSVAMGSNRSLALLAREAFLAFLGGLILNLMPCIFPILSIKVLSFIQHSHQPSGHIRRHGLVFTAGVLVTFSVIALTLILLRGAGDQIGWGFQLQSPGFVMVLAYLLFALGLSLSGAFTLGNTLMGVGSRLADRPGYGGAFASGALATVVATPCTAPFMGAALGYALAQPWYTGLIVFQSMGLGLAFPYLLLTFNPQLFRFLPRPGVWMVRLKELLAFPLYATVVWLVWVLSLQTGPGGILAVLVGILLIGFAAWLWQITRAGKKRRVLGSVGVMALLLIALGLAAVPSSFNHQDNAVLAVRQSGEGPVWEPFSRERLAELRAAGKPVFINFTAAWCMTCLANERVALSSHEVAEQFAQAGVVYLKGDWTNRDPEITDFLNAFGRSGVPLYVYYPPGAAKPIILPQILSERLVLQKLNLAQASGPVLNEMGF